ncbi:MAG: hypothetical protein V3U02_02330 [Calditrichia bacterium]
MTSNKVSGNMYPFVTLTKNYIKGICEHDCTYCYIKAMVPNLKPARFDKSELKEDLGDGEYYFIGSSCDMWAKSIPAEWIETALEHCRKYPKNTYLFQSKNPIRFHEFVDKLPPDSILCTTIETNRNIRVKVNGVERPVSYAPLPAQRAIHLAKLVTMRKSVTLEPIMDFDIHDMVALIRHVNPEFVSIGANSKESQLGKLPEPSRAKLESLIIELESFTNVILKKNLKRLRE